MTYDLVPRMDRRKFITVSITAGAGVLAVTALPSVLGSILNSGPRFTPAADLHHDGLANMIGDTLKVTNSGTPTSDLLVERVTPLAPYGSNDGRTTGDAFSIVFSGPAEAPLGQDTYELHHSTLGVFPVFLSPVDLTDGEDQRYEAVFNRLR